MGVVINMAKIEKWHNNISKLSLTQAKNYLQALNTLFDWQMFNKEFGGVGLATLQTILKLKIHNTKEEM